MAGRRNANATAASGLARITGCPVELPAELLRRVPHVLPKVADGVMLLAADSRHLVPAAARVFVVLEVSERFKELRPA